MGEIAKWLFVGGGGATLVAGVQAVLSRRKIGSEAERTDADAASILSKTAMELVEPLGKRIKELEAEVGDLRRQVREAVGELEACRTSNRAKDREITRLRAQPST